MPKITHLSFNNYRAFWGADNSIKIDGKNLLVYGENGSGKSSLYQGLKDFFTASDVTWTPDPSPIHLKAENNEYTVRVVFDGDEENPIIFDGQTVENAITQQTFLLNSFLSYKELLRTHFLERNEIFAEKFFELLTETLLKEHEIGGTTIGKALEDLQNKLVEASEAAKPEAKVELLRKLRETNPDADEDDLEEIDTKAEKANFKSLFDEKLAEIINPLNRLLSYFNQGVTVKFDNVQLSFDEQRKKLKGAISLDVNYIEIEHINHLKILNEARLSALAISIYLAALITNPIVQKANYKILFLDDVFIGLDTSNRLPLLDILQTFRVEKPSRDENGEEIFDEAGNRKIKKVAFFKDFQIFITTYDRYWFDLAKKNLNDTWIWAEMYVGEERKDGKKLFEKPVILQDQLEPLEKAIRFFEAFDYYSAGNYLRKALEKELENLIDKTYQIEAKDLEGMISKLFSYYEDCDCKNLIPQKLRAELKMFKDSVLNPSSHYDLKSPMYRAEIETTIKMIKELQKLPKIERIPIALRKTSLFYQNNEKDYRAEYMLRDEICAVKTEGNPPKILDANHSIIFWSLNNQDFAKKDGSNSSEEDIEVALEKSFKLSVRVEKIKHFLDLENAPDWKEFTNRNGKTLTQLANEI
jgi:hypothetical protein